MSQAESRPVDWVSQVLDHTLFGRTTETGLTKKQEHLARVVARCQDFERLEAVFGLESGAIDQLMEVDAFKALVEQSAEDDRREARSDVDWGRGLREDQRKAARLLVYGQGPTGERLTKDQVAAEVGVTSRSIRNWETKDPIFVAYRDQLHARKEAEELEELRRADDEVLETLQVARLDAARQLADKARNGDLSACRDLLHRFLRKM